MDAFLDSCKKTVQRFMRVIARGLLKLSGSKLSPNTVTLVGLAAHVPIAFLIANNEWYWAAGLLVMFGLFDTLDGELARLQNKASAAGMLLDSVTDRMKEIVLYTGIAYALASRPLPTNQETGYIAAWIVAACGGSVLVSYINAWGEVVLASTKGQGHRINQTFRSGLMRFEVRMFLLVVGLLTGQLMLAVVLIAILAWATAVQRLVKITAKLKNV